MVSPKAWRPQVHLESQPWLISTVYNRRWDVFHSLFSQTIHIFNHLSGKKKEKKEEDFLPSLALHGVMRMLQYPCCCHCPDQPPKRPVLKIKKANQTK